MYMDRKLEKFIEQATSNITEDRAATKSLLMTLMKYMQVSDDRHGRGKISRNASKIK